MRLSLNRKSLFFVWMTIALADRCLRKQIEIFLLASKHRNISTSYVHLLFRLTVSHVSHSTMSSVYTCLDRLRVHWHTNSCDNQTLWSNVSNPWIDLDQCNNKIWTFQIQSHDNNRNFNKFIQSKAIIFIQTRQLFQNEEFFGCQSDFQITIQLWSGQWVDTLNFTVLTVKKTQNNFSSTSIATKNDGP